MIFPPTGQHLRLGLGGAALGNLFEPMPDAQAHAVIQAALSNACQTFDTAAHYGNGLSEHRFGAGLRHLPRDRYALSTKVGRILTADSNAAPDQHGYVGVLPYTQHWDYSAAGVRRSVEDSLQRLGLARLDTVFVHDCDALTHGAAYPAVLHQVVHEALPELRRMQAQGLVQHIGLGVNDVQVCLDVLGQTTLDCLLLAGRYTLIDHSALPHLLPLCLQKGVRIALGGAFNSGILATGVSTQGSVRFNYQSAPAHWVERVAQVEAICAAHLVPLRAAALQFALAHPAIDIVLLGARDVAQWEDGVAMLQCAIPAAFWQALQSAGLIPIDAPLPS
jgi:D-threo-aldose 1-dehydrogenase